MGYLIEKLYRSLKMNTVFSKIFIKLHESFLTLLESATVDCFFIFDGKYCKQKDAVAMGSPLVPTLTNMFLCHFEEQ